MRVLMISLDRGLFGRGYSGDVIERHKKYANLAGGLDIIVFASDKYPDLKIQDNLRIFSTKSKKSRHFREAARLADVLFKENQYDLVVTQEFASPVGKKIKQKFGMPWIVNIHGMFFSRGWLKLDPLKWYLLYQIKSAVKLADGFRVNNEIIRNQLQDWGIHKPILVQPTPIDIEKFSAKGGSPPSPGSGRAGASGGKTTTSNFKPTVLYVGRLSKEKNVAMLIEAVKDLPSHLTLQIVGSGPEENRLKRLATSDPKINFLGPKTFEELPEIFSEADIFVLPSNTESFGQVLIQAAAVGLAIIATKTAGAMSILSDNVNAILIPIKDRKSLQHALQRLTEDESLRQHLSEAALEIPSKYDSQIGIENTIDFWREIVK